MGIDDKFPGDALVKVGIALGRGIQRDDGRVDGFGDLDAVVQNCHHQGAVVLQDRRLAGEKGVRLRPSEAEVKAAIAAIIKETGAASVKDMGKVMAALKERFAGKMDFGKASGAVKGLLG